MTGDKIEGAEVEIREAERADFRRVAEMQYPAWRASP